MYGTRLASSILCTAVRAVIYTSDHHNLQNDNEKVMNNNSSNMKFTGVDNNTFQEPKHLENRSNVQNMEHTEHLWKSIWHLSPTKPNLDLRIKEAWQLGYTGRGVVVAVVDDGLDWTHPDIRPNYDKRASYNCMDMCNDPMPTYAYQSHGTACAGIVAASTTSRCTVGVAFNARIGGIRREFPLHEDSKIAMALNYNMDYIDIYSSSWSPTSLGIEVDGPGVLEAQALERGATKGRNGKGSIFVFSAGNGLGLEESCAGNGYVNSIYTIGITSANENGDSPYYGMRGSNILATTFSSDREPRVRGITTTGTQNSCTTNFGGTSASAPIASGIIALALEANPRLGWRDVQHIIVRTANSRGLSEKHWKQNGVGRRVSDTFGYGLLDAAAMVKLAKVWKPVPEQQKCEINFCDYPRTISNNDTFKQEIYYAGNQVAHLENVQVSITLKSARRGEIEVHLTSPMGTKSILFPKRPKDTSYEGFSNFHFLTTHLWGESAKGIWTLEVVNGDWRKATLGHCSLIMFGTTEKPQE